MIWALRCLSSMHKADVLCPKSVYTACNIACFILLHTLYASLRAAISEQLPICSVCSEISSVQLHFKNTEYSPNIYTEPWLKWKHPKFLGHKQFKGNYFIIWVLQNNALVNKMIITSAKHQHYNFKSYLRCSQMHSMYTRIFCCHIV